MNEIISEEERAYSQRIYTIRKQGDIIEAIEVCREAIQKFGKSNFFYKINGDLLFENGEFDEALNSYLIFLDRIKNKPEYFTNFAKFFKRLNLKKTVDEAVFNKLANIVRDKTYPYILKKSMINLLLDTFIIPPELEEMINKVLIHPISVKMMKEDYERVSSSGKCRYIDRVNETVLKYNRDQRRVIVSRRVLFSDYEIK